MSIEEVIDELQEHHGAVIEKMIFRYSVKIWDRTIDEYLYLELTESELINLYDEYFKK
jgi:hypothetical protein